MTREEFQTLTEEKIVYLDGAMGTNLYEAGMPKGVSTEGWILEHTEVVKKLQAAYVEAGSQILYAPTFGANRHVLESFGLDARIEDMNRRLVELSREASMGKAYVAGDIAPTGMLLESCGGEDTLDDVFEVYREQIAILAAEGVDLLVVETMMSVDEAAIALDAAAAVCDLPVMVSLTANADGRCFYGGTVQEGMETLQAMGASAVGINCCSGPDQVESLVRNMAQIAQIPVIAKPNAGMPIIDEKGNAVYQMGPEEFAGYMKKLTQAGAGIIGGCCGTKPEYIRKTILAVEGKLITNG